MPSFDIVSQVNSMEIENAVNQAKKELANRFDFKGTKAEIMLEKNEIKLSAEDQFKIRALTEIVMGKLAKRNISLKSVDKGEPDVSPLGHSRQLIKIKQGLDQAVAKQVTGFIRERKFKVTTQIQGDEVRVTSKSRDELQAVIGDDPHGFLAAMLKRMQPEHRERARVGMPENPENAAFLVQRIVVEGCAVSGHWLPSLLPVVSMR